MYLRTSRVRIGRTLLDFPSFDDIMNGRETLKWLRTQPHLIGWTFCYNFLTLEQLKFDQLICASNPKQLPYVRIASNNHAKCYIGERVMVISSFNLTEPTVNDLAVRIVKRATIKRFRELFDKQWNQL